MEAKPSMLQNIEKQHNQAMDGTKPRDNSVVHEMNHGLSTVMSEGGSNLSVGQRQLVCLARAILRGNKILEIENLMTTRDQFGCIDLSENGYHSIQPRLCQNMVILIGDLCCRVGISPFLFQSW